MPQPQQAPVQPGRSTEKEVIPGAPKTTPQPRRRTTPNPATSPTPAPKAQKKGFDKPRQVKGDGPKQGPAGVNESVKDTLKKIIDRYMGEFNKLHEADYDKIFDPDTLKNLKGSVNQRIQGKNPMNVAMQMQQLAMQVTQLERGNEDLLEQLAKDVVFEAYPYLESSDAIEIDAKIVPQAQVKDALKPDSPEEEDIDDLSDEDVKEIEADLAKRRLINAITQGSASMSKTAHYLQQEYIDIVGGDGTSDKYRDLMQAALDMIDIMVSMGMTGANGGGGMENSSVGAESVFYDFEKEKWIIKARAICFPVLVHEIVKGMYEIIGLFGFNSLERGEKVVGKVDKIQNEPEDISYGQTIAKALQKLINDIGNISALERDYLLQDIYKLDNTEFIQLMTNLINGRITNDQMNMVKGMVNDLKRDLAADDMDSALDEVTKRWQAIAGLRPLY